MTYAGNETYYIEDSWVFAAPYDNVIKYLTFLLEIWLFRADLDQYIRNNTRVKINEPSWTSFLWLRSGRKLSSVKKYVSKKQMNRFRLPFHEYVYLFFFNIQLAAHNSQLMYSLLMTSFSKLLSIPRIFVMYIHKKCP